jgi:glycosyltransferase involved in cell wall biosynthesis
MPGNQPTVDIFIPTLNESAHIAETVANARALGEVFVLDSISTDGTQELARAAGATVVEHAFENYSAQKNWGLDNLPMRADWVFILDADERLTPPLLAEIRRTIAGPAAADGYFVSRMVIFMGRGIRHGGLFPSWNLRLFRRGRARYEQRPVHEHMVCDGPTGYLVEPMLHLRRESIWRYLDKHIHYADLESDEWIRQRFDRSGAAKPGLLFKSRLGIRQWLRREIWPIMPLRPLYRFLMMYFLRLGFLDGRAGWELARLMSCYEYMIGLLYREKLERIARVRKATHSAGPQLPAERTASKVT